MKTSITFSAFCDAFRDMGRNDQFSYDGKRALFDYLEETFEGEYELDVIALCCDYAESSVEELVNDYNIDVSGAEDDEEMSDIVEEYLNENTCLVGKLKDGSFVYAQF